jgi:protein transport protein SEC61 subunit gamma-like protein
MDEIEVQPQGRVRRFLKECGRVIHVTKKPSKEEYKNTLKITAIGAAIIGLLGFIIFLLKQLLIG